MLGLYSLLSCIVFHLSEINGQEYEGKEVLKIQTDLRRPIWNVAHMVNTRYQVDRYLDQGANSIEFDISFDWQGIAQYTYHGVPCDCFRTCTRYEHFIPFLDYMRRLTTPGDLNYRRELILLFMDVKVKSLNREAIKRAGKDLATKIIDHYWIRGTSGARAYILLSVPSVKQMEFVDSFRRTLQAKNFSHYNPKIGFEFSKNEDLGKILHTYRELNINDQIWQGDGITNCWFRGTSRLREALRRRDQPGRTHINKVYRWTIDKMSSMRRTLRLGVDGLITNHPHRLITVLNEAEFSDNLRLATYYDNPWTKYSYRI